jgi:hypothetical protein
MITGGKCMKKVFVLIFILAWILCSCINQETINTTSNSPENDPTSIIENSQTSGSTESPNTSTETSVSEEYLSIEAYKAVLQNTVCFNSPYDKKDLFLNDFLSSDGSGYEVELEVTHFTVLDMDGDEIPEVVLELTVVGKEWPDFYEVLHYMNGTVYGYLKVYRGLGELKNDGTFMFSSSSSNWGFSKLRFTSNTCEDDRLGYCEPGDNSELYFVNNKSVTAELFDSFYNDQNGKEGAAWYEFSRDNIETELSCN